jgi:hypothetical protein
MTVGEVGERVQRRVGERERLGRGRDRVAHRRAPPA